MQEYRKIPVTKDEIVPVARRMRDEGVILAMIHGYVTPSGAYNISYEYQKGEVIESYTIEGEDNLPTISTIYDEAAAWPERELNELIGITFEGLDTSKRLFMPDSMLDGQGQILVTPMDELIEKTHKKEEE